MNIQAFKNKNGIIILICLLAVVLIYFIDPLKLSYRTAAWKTFGQAPVEIVRVDYFIPDTPDVIGYPEPGSGEMVSCSTTVAYVSTAAGEAYRCCDTGNRSSCLAGDFSSDIPAEDPECTRRLQNALGVPTTLEGVQDYHVFSNCAEGSNAELTVTQLDGSGTLLWKYLDVGGVARLNSGLRCILAPFLVLMAIAVSVITLRNRPTESIRKLW